MLMKCGHDSNKYLIQGAQTGMVLLTGYFKHNLNYTCQILLYLV